MNAIELINYIKQQPLISHAIPVLVNGEQVNGIQLVEDLQCGYVFNIICNGVQYRKTKEIAVPRSEKAIQSARERKLKRLMKKKYL